MNCGPDWDNDTARSPQTGGPLASMSRDRGVIRRLSNLHIEKTTKLSNIPVPTSFCASTHGKITTKNLQENCHHVEQVSSSPICIQLLKSLYIFCNIQIPRME